MSSPTRYSAWEGSATKDMPLEEYVGLLHKAVGTTFHNSWSPGLMGPKFPNPGANFNTHINVDVIRKYLDAVGDLNPLYRHGGFAPPTILFGVAYGFYVDPLVIPTSPDFPNTYGGHEWRWFQP